MILTVFTAYYYCMSKNVTKLISPRVLCTSSHKTHVLSWFDRLYGLDTTVWAKNVTKLRSPRVLCTNSLQLVFLADLTVLRLITTVWSKIVTKLISPRNLCHKCRKSFVLSWFDRFTAYYNRIEQKCHKTHISAISLQKNHKFCC